MKPMIPIYIAAGIVTLGGISLMFLSDNGELGHEDIQIGFTEEERPVETYEGTSQELRRLIADFQTTQRGFKQLQEGYEDTIREIEQKNRKFEAQLNTEKRARKSAIEQYDRQQDKEMKKAIDKALRVLAEDQANSKHQASELQSHIERMQAEIEELRNRPPLDPVVIHDTPKPEQIKPESVGPIYSIKSRETIKAEIEKPNAEDWNEALKPEIEASETIELKPIGGKVQIKKDRKRQDNTSRRVNYRSESRMPSRRTSQKQPKTNPAIPMFTVNSGGIMKASMMNAAIGMVPFGGQVTPFTTHAVIKNSKNNPAASGYYLAPEVGEMRIMGPAIGNIAVGCALVSITKISFIFHDGSIYEDVAKSGEPFGYLDDEFGRGCLYGTLIDNVDNYASNEAFYATLDGSIRSLQRVLTQDQYSKVLADGAVEGAGTWADKSSELHQKTRYAGIYYSPNQTVFFVTNQMIKIDYSPKLRKLAHDQVTRGFTHRLHPD